MIRALRFPLELPKAERRIEHGQVDVWARLGCLDSHLVLQSSCVQLGLDSKPHEDGLGVTENSRSLGGTLRTYGLPTFLDIAKVGLRAAELLGATESGQFFALANGFDGPAERERAARQLRKLFGGLPPFPPHASGSLAHLQIGGAFSVRRSALT
jgi:hypothetical protein